MSAMIQAALQYVLRQGELTVAGEGEAIRPESPGDLAAKVLRDFESKWEGAVLRVHCELAPGYHFNAHDAAVEPPRLTAVGADIEGISYPAGEMSGEFEILVRFKSAARGAFRLSLSYQACNDAACLPRATRTLEIAARD